MKDILPAVRTILLTNGAVSNAVGGNRVYSGVLPQGVIAQSLVMNIITEESNYHMQGDDGVQIARVQIDAWAQSRDAAAALANLAIDALSGYTGIVTYGTNSPQISVVVQGVFHDSGRDDYDSTTKMFAKHRDYMIWFEGR